MDWIGIKNRWKLTVTSAEWATLASMLDTCPGGSPRVIAAPAPAWTPTPTATPTGSRGVCGGATTTIVSVDKAAKPEVVTITGNGDLTGFYLLSVRDNQRYDFPAGFQLGGSVEILSYIDQFTDTAAELWWTKSATGTTTPRTMASSTTARGSV